jgi:hypothetical protein
MAAGQPPTAAAKIIAYWWSKRQTVPVMELSTTDGVGSGAKPPAVMLKKDIILLRLPIVVATERC